MPSKEMDDSYPSMEVEVVQAPHIPRQGLATSIRHTGLKRRAKRFQRPHAGKAVRYMDKAYIGQGCVISADNCA
jgi:hypothetical protein